MTMRTIEPYLGDIIGEAPAPMRPVYLRRIDARCYVQRFVHRALAITAALVLGSLIAIHLAALFAFYPASSFALAP